mmetsp:Transcript_28877/g.51464  ORF Transcript_28877/g.51464 Transcript_28877/m.51464 type:complete len:172 (-) Transcript_28877:986-1501(-)
MLIQYSDRPRFSLVAKALQKYPKTSTNKRVRPVSFDSAPTSHPLIIRIPDVNKDNSKSPYRCRFHLKESVGVSTEDRSPLKIKLEPLQPLNTNFEDMKNSFNHMPPVQHSKPPLPKLVKRARSSSSMRLPELNTSLEDRPKVRKENKLLSLAECLDLKSERRRKGSRACKL